MTDQREKCVMVDVSVMVPVHVFDVKCAPGVAVHMVREALRNSRLRDVEPRSMCWKVEQ